MAVLNLTEDELRELVNKETAGNVLYVLEGEGIAPGSFTRALIEAAVKADTFNTMKLGQAYPEIVAAVHAYRFADFGLSVLKNIFKENNA